MILKYTQQVCGEAGNTADIKVTAVCPHCVPCMSVCPSHRHVGSCMHPRNTGSLGTLTHLLDGGLQGDVQVVHPRQLHRLVNALGCQ